MLDPPLNREGVERIARTLKFVKSQNFKITRIVSSPLQRASKVAQLLANGNRVTVNNGCLPWNLGDLMGKPTKLVESKIHHLEAYPDLKAPHGESYRSFHSRWTNFLYTLMSYAEERPDEHLVVVTHSRNIDDTKATVDGRGVGQVRHESPEASVTLLAETGSGDWNYEMIWDGE